MENNENKMPIYQIVIDTMDSETGLLRNSFVDDPAVEYTKLDFNKELLKMGKDDSQQKFMSVSLVADTVIPRLDGEGKLYGVVFTKESINDIVNNYMLSGNINEVSYQHTEEIIDGVYLVEHFITKKGIVESPFFKDLPDGSWVTTYHVPDTEQYNKLKNDETFNGFSVEISALLENYNYNSISIEDKIKSILEEDISELEMENKIKELL